MRDYQLAHGDVRVICGDSREGLRLLPDQSVHCCVTSPPYWGLRSYLPEGHPDKPKELGGERLHDCGGWVTGSRCGECYVCRMVDLFREVRRVLRDDGTLWLNLGDAYAGAWGNYGGQNRGKGTQRQIVKGSQAPNAAYDGLERWRPPNSYNLPGLKQKDLCGMPWRTALALQADGWWLRSDIIWCLSGGTWLYVRSQKGDMPMTVKDLRRLDPRTVKLWNGQKWTQLKGVSRSDRRGDELKLTLRSGERISCTPTHKFPTQRGLLEAGSMRVGDRLVRTRLPEPDHPRDCAIDTDSAYLAGAYIANGSRSGEVIQIAVNTNKTGVRGRLRDVAAKFGGTYAEYTDGGCCNIHMHGKVLHAIIDVLVGGKSAHDKCFGSTVWRYSDAFLASAIHGYLEGDGHWDAPNDRWRLKFCYNTNLERDLRTACARLGYAITLRTGYATGFGRRIKTFRGEMRMSRSGHHNEKSREEIIRIERSRASYYYDLGVEDDPHLFALASGVLSHNSKANGMPSSVRDRPGCSHEYVFLLAKSDRYFYDCDAIRDAHKPDSVARMKNRKANMPRDRHDADRLKGGNWNDYQDRETGWGNPHGANARTVWHIPTSSGRKEGSHFAVFSPRLVMRCLLAGTSSRGVCAACGAPWQRVVEREKFQRPKEYRRHAGESGHNNPTGKVPGSNTRGMPDPHVTTVGWAPGCDCGADVAQAVVLDPFGGSGVVASVALQKRRRAVLLELNPDYVEIIKHKIRKAEKNRGFGL